jgi:hypothetical protein
MSFSARKRLLCWGMQRFSWRAGSKIEKRVFSPKSILTPKPRFKMGQIFLADDDIFSDGRRDIQQ